MLDHRASSHHAVAGYSVGTALLIAWDLLLDPAMSKVTSYWIWGEAGSYYGMPWTNLVGWGMTGLALFLILAKLAPRPAGNIGFALSVYAVNFSLPLGFCLLNGYWLATFAAVTTAGVAWLAVAAWANRDIPGRRLRDSLAESRKPA
jgi:putative membrane protein